MKKIFLAIAMVLLLASIALAADDVFVTCDPVAGATFYKVMGLPATIDASNIPALTTGPNGFLLKVTDLITGAYTITAQACASGAGWPKEVCTGDSSPFSFTRPSAPSAAPTNIRLGLQ